MVRRSKGDPDTFPPRLSSRQAFPVVLAAPASPKQPILLSPQATQCRIPTGSLDAAVLWACTQASHPTPLVRPTPLRVTRVEVTSAGEEGALLK